MPNKGYPWFSDDVNEKLIEVDKLILATAGKGRLGKETSRLILAGGKRLRPGLTLSCALLGEKPLGEHAISSAAAVEMIHLASLVHDDILDGGAHRRGRPAVASRSAALAVLLGDFLVAKALLLAASSGESVAALLAGTVAEMAAGEADEVGAKAKIKPLSPGYFQQARQKSAGLFAAAAEVGASIAALPEKKTAELARYGEDFGIAFQLIDDIKDGRMPASQHTRAKQEINRLIASAQARIGGNEGETGRNLISFPADYLVWASPL